MKIAIFSDTFFPQVNGVANTAYSSAKILAEAGHEVKVFAAISEKDRKFLKEKEKFEIISFPSVPAMVYPGEKLVLPFTLVAFSKLKKFRPDIIHTHTPFLVGWFAVIAAKILGAKLVGTHHTFYDHYLKHIKLDYSWGKKISWKYTVWYYNFCDLILSPSKSLGDELIKKNLARPVKVLANAVRTDLFKPVSAMAKKEIKKKFRADGPLLVHMGRLSYEKSIDRVISAFASAAEDNNEIKLMIVGDGPERKNLEKIVSDRRINDRVIFTGVLHGQELIESLQAGDAFITSSKSENMPLSVLEAMATGMPVIAVPEKGLLELVKEEINGFLVPFGDTRKMSKKIIELFSDKKLIKKFGAASRKIAEECSPESVLSALEDAYKKTMANRLMKICLYLEFYNFLGGFLYKKIGTGLLSSYHNQKKIIKELGMEFTESWDDSCDILQINTPWLWSLYIIRKARAKNKKVIIWAHVTVEDARKVFWFNDLPLVAWLIKKYLTFAYGLADLVFCPSEYTKSLLMAYGLPEEKLIAMSNGVDAKKFYYDEKKRELGRKQYGLSGMAVGTVGLAIPRKGIDSFLFLARKFPENKFIWFGKIYSALLVKSLPKKISSNVNFTGYVDNILEAFNSLDIFVFLSYEENQGMVILEAASLGLPILVRDIPAYNGWLVDGENCLKAKNDDELIMRLEALIKDKKLRDKLGKNAKILAEKNSIPEIAQKTMAVYEKLLGL